MSKAFEELKKEAKATKEHLMKLEAALAIIGRAAVVRGTKAAVRGTKSAVRSVKKWSTAANAKRSASLKAFYANRKKAKDAKKN
jgi:hypothetical protein